MLSAVRELIIPFVKRADDAAAQKHTGQVYRNQSGEVDNTLVDYQTPADLVSRLKLVLPEEGNGKDGLIATIKKLLQYSVNTWDQGFMDKLFAANTPVCSSNDSCLLFSKGTNIP